MHPLARLDHRHVWHPFTQMRDWLKSEPIVLVKGRGSVLEDVHGRRYLDANSSIWTNLHGHRNPAIDRALRRQLSQVAHTSSLGFASGPAAELAAELVGLARGPKDQPRLGKVFFSDDGSTAIEAALKLAAEHSRRAGITKKPRFLSLQGAYHGDTVGAVSVGHIELFHRTWKPLLFPTDAVMSPYCSGVLSTGPSRSAPTRGPGGSAAGNASRRWRTASRRRPAPGNPTRRSSSNRRSKGPQAWSRNRKAGCPASPRSPAHTGRC
jgi:adenosylmethionine-8-amino-7-oxononanoate aminotransferase